MNRKTDKHWRNNDPWELCGLGKDCKRGCVNSGEWCNVALMIRKLAKYEDTGLEPDEIETISEYAFELHEEFSSPLDLSYDEVMDVLSHHFNVPIDSITIVDKI